jgi:UDP:flavonoid glycosyltransferase YjiC (YdhE family)
VRNALSRSRNIAARSAFANLRIESWLPSQLDVLAHPHVTLFFNHSGTDAYHEGLYFGKPQVMRPLWMDCHDIATRSRDLGIGTSPPSCEQQAAQNRRRHTPRTTRTEED